MPVNTRKALEERLAKVKEARKVATAWKHSKTTNSLKRVRSFDRGRILLVRLGVLGPVCGLAFQLSRDEVVLVRWNCGSVL